MQDKLAALRWELIAQEDKIDLKGGPLHGVAAAPLSVRGNSAGHRKSVDGGHSDGNPEYETDGEEEDDEEAEKVAMESRRVAGAQLSPARAAAAAARAVASPERNGERSTANKPAPRRRRSRNELNRPSLTPIPDDGEDTDGGSSQPSVDAALVSAEPQPTPEPREHLVDFSSSAHTPTSSRSGSRSGSRSASGGRVAKSTRSSGIVRRHMSSPLLAVSSGSGSGSDLRGSLVS